MNNEYYMIVDGLSLIEILKSEKLSFKFFKLGIVCRSVICCRVTPKQKSEVVLLAKSFGDWITLSVGDGANDVPMIMEAHIGIGVQGKEGTQAVRSADYAVCQFKYIQRLLLVHGRLGYRRISTFICYYFYKNLILIFSEIYFSFFNGFSGQNFFPEFLPVLYNGIWTSWPCIFAFSIEKDIQSDYRVRRGNNLLGRFFEVIPSFYKAGQSKYYFNMKVFWIWLMTAVIHGGLSFILVLLGIYKHSLFDDGKIVDHWYLTTIIFSQAIHIVTYKIFIQCNFWNPLIMMTSALSIGMYYLSIFLINIPTIGKLVQPELVAKVFSMFSSYVFWIYVLISPLLIVALDIITNLVYKTINPSPVDMINLNLIKTKNDENIVKRLSKLKDPKILRQRVTMELRNI
jgi:magnesium-transporting ATPase (P-type)